MANFQPDTNDPNWSVNPQASLSMTGGPLIQPLAGGNPLLQALASQVPQNQPLAPNAPPALVQAVRAAQQAPAQSPLMRQSGMLPAMRPVPGIGGLTGPYDERIAQRSAQEDAALASYNKALEMEAQGYEGMAKSQGAYKDLLHDTMARLGALQYGPSKGEMAARVGAGMAGPFGLARDLGGGAAAAAQGAQQQREAAIQRELQQAQLGTNAVQAEQMAHQYEVQGGAARAQGMLARANAAEHAQDVLSNQRVMAAQRQQQYDPASIAAKAAAQTAGQMAGAFGGMPGGGNTTAAAQSAAQSATPEDAIAARNPLAGEIAKYLVQMPNPPVAGRNPAAYEMALRGYNNLLRDVTAINPDFQQGNKTRADSLRKQFDGTTANSPGSQLRFLGNVAGHLQTYDHIMQQAQAAGLKEGMPAYNALLQAWATQIGHPEITNADAVREFLGPEFAKVIVPTGATQVERQQKEASIKASLGPDQWNGVRNTLTEVLGTQASGLEHTYRDTLNSIGLPQHIIDREWAARTARPELRTILDAHDARDAPTKNDIAWVKAHPEDMENFQKKFPGYNLQ